MIVRGFRSRPWWNSKSSMNSQCGGPTESGNGVPPRLGRQLCLELLVLRGAATSPSVPVPSVPASSELGTCLRQGQRSQHGGPGRAPGFIS